MRLTAPLLVVALALAACGDDDDAADTTDDTVATTTAEAATTAAGGGNVVEVDDLDVQFEAPEGWETVDPETVGDFSDDAVLAELAERTGVSTDALRNTMTDQVELFVFSGESEGAIASNINAIALPVADLPSAEQIEADFGTLGATDVTVETAEAGGNDALIVRYQLPLDDERVAQGYGLFVDVGDEIVNLTVTAFERAEADEVGELVRSTVTPLD